MEGNLLNLSGDYFYSIAALFSCLAYLLRSILWLRILLACAAITYIVSGVSFGITSMIGWNSAYLAINLFHIGLLLLDRVTITLPAETRGIYQRFFPTMSTREFKKLITNNQFCLFQDEKIVTEFEVPKKLFLVLRGRVDVVRDGNTIATLHAGDFIGEMSFLTGEPASASACATDLVQCAFWTHDDLERLREKNIESYNKFIAIIGCDLVRKLKHKNKRQLDLINQLDFII